MFFSIFTHMKVLLYDTTLRDGNQDRKISLSLADKVQIARILDHFGFDYIEGGWPNPSNPTDEEFFKLIKDVKLKHAKIAAFGSTRRPGILPENDPLLQALIKSEAPVKTIFGKSWDLHVTDVIRTTLEENLDMIESSVAYLKEHSEEVIYDAEHFFDGYKANPEYALETLKAAELGHADCIVLCDTNGGTMPWEIEEIVKKVQARISTPLGIHVHNDSGLAVANSIYAVKAGCIMVQGVVNGYGERCGNANLTTIAADLKFKMDCDFTAAKKLSHLRQLSGNIDQIVNLQNGIAIPSITGTKNTGSLIKQNSFFWLNGTLCFAKIGIANGATFTSSNYESATSGGLNTLVSKIEDPSTLYAIIHDTRFTGNANIRRTKFAGVINIDIICNTTINDWTNIATYAIPDDSRVPYIGYMNIDGAIFQCFNDNGVYRLRTQKIPEANKQYRSSFPVLFINS